MNPFSIFPVILVLFACDRSLEPPTDRSDDSFSNQNRSPVLPSKPDSRMNFSSKEDTAKNSKNRKNGLKSTKSSIKKKEEEESTVQYQQPPIIQVNSLKIKKRYEKKIPYANWKDFAAFKAALAKSTSWITRDKSEFLTKAAEKAVEMNSKKWDLSLDIKSYQWEDESRLNSVLDATLPSEKWNDMEVTARFFDYNADQIKHAGDLHGYIVAANQDMGGHFQNHGNVQEERLLLDMPAVGEAVSQARTTAERYGVQKAPHNETYVIYAPVIAQIHSSSYGQQYNAMRTHQGINLFLKDVKWFDGKLLKAALLFTRAEALWGKPYSLKLAQQDLLRASQVFLAAKEANITRLHWVAVGGGVFGHPPEAALIRAFIAASLANYPFKQIEHQGYRAGGTDIAKTAQEGAITFLEANKNRTIKQVLQNLVTKYY